MINFAQPTAGPQAPIGERPSFPYNQPTPGGQPTSTVDMVRQAVAAGVDTNRKVASGFMGPLSAPPQWQVGKAQLDPTTLALMQAYFGAIKTDITPHQNSDIFNQLSGGEAADMKGKPAWEQVAKGIYQNTVGSFVDQAKQDPLLAAGEILGVAGLIVGAGLLDASTAGLATPLLWTGFAALAAPHILPNLVDNVHQAITNPSDATTIALLITVGSAALTLGSPVKAFRGIGATRSLLASQAQSFRFVHQPGEAVSLMLKYKNGKEIPYLLPEDRFAIIPQTVDQLEQEVARMKAEGKDLAAEDETLIEKYRTALQEHDIHNQKLADLESAFTEGVDPSKRPRAEGGKFTNRADYLDDINQRFAEAQVPTREAEEALIPIQKEVAHRYGYVLARESPMALMSKEELTSVGGLAAAKADKQFRGLWGILHFAGEGHGWDGAPEGLMHDQFAKNLAEAMARGDANGGLEHAQRLLHTQLLQGAKELGVKESRMDDIYAAVEGHRDPQEDAKLWTALSPQEKYFARQLHVTFGIMTNYAYKHGHIEVPLHRYVPRMVTHDDPQIGRGTRATQRSVEALTPASRAVQNRSWALDRPGDVPSEWGLANELQDAEFDPEEGMGTISERLRQTHKPWKEFNDGEQTKRTNYAEFMPAREAFRDATRKMVEGKETTNNQFLLEKRREHGSYLRTVNLMGKRLEEAPAKLGDLVRNLNEDKQSLDTLLNQRGLLKGSRGGAAQRAALDNRLKILRNQIRKNTTAHKNLTGDMKKWEETQKRYQNKLDNMPAQWVKQAGLEHVPNVEKWFRVENAGGINRDELKSRLNAQPGGRKLLSGFDLPRVSFRRYLLQMNQTRFREAWDSISHTPVDETTKLAYGAKAGLSIAEIRMKAAAGEDTPIALRSDVPLGEPYGDPHQALYDSGYEMVMPAMGKQGSLNYRPAIFGRKDVVGRYREMAQQARTSSEMQSAFARTVYNVSVGVPKRLIMGSPAWHGKNVTGRALAVFLQHPGLASQALFKTLKDRFHDPEMYYQTKMEHWMDGGVPANKFNVTDHLNWLEQEMSGQRNFGYSMRHPLGALGHAHAEAAEGWFWKTVDDVGTMAYVAQKHRSMAANPWMTERMAGMIAAEYGNNVAGMVNPLYMSKLWRWGRQMTFFAPTWWSTFYRIVGQSMPGMSRLSNVMQKSKRFQALDPVKMHSLDMRHRQEMIRIHRSYFITMMSAAMVTHDAMNFLFSGHHVWDNNKGHEWDVEMDKMYAPKEDLKTGQVQHVHLHSVQLYAQMADLMNAMGIGHDWGFIHQTGTDEWKHANALHKIGMAAGAADQGISQTGAGKLSTAVNLGVGGVMGIDPYALMRDKQVQEIPRWEALLGTLPGGFQAQKQIDSYRRAEDRARITGDQKGVQAEGQKILPTAAKATLGQFIGLPTMYYSGDEPSAGYHFLTMQQSAQYLQQRQTILDTKKKLSEKLLDGGMPPNDWIVQNEMQTQKYLQLLSDTFGDNSTGKSLFDARKKLYSKYNLDDPSLSRSDFQYNLEQFQQDWNDQLQHSSTEAKSMWWETHTSMWTDADYLYWMSSQMRQAVASHIDGQGGRHIREAQRRLGAQGLPLDPKATDALRQQDPQLWAYQQVISQMGRSTLLGALGGAYHDPFSNFAVFPDDMGPTIQALDQAGALRGGATMVSESTMRGLAAGAKGQAQGAGPEAGQVAETPGMQQAAGGLSAEMAQQILAAQGDLSPTSTKRLDPQLIAYLEQVAAGGQVSG